MALLTGKNSISNKPPYKYQHATIFKCFPLCNYPQDNDETFSQRESASWTRAPEVGPATSSTGQSPNGTRGACVLGQLLPPQLQPMQRDRSHFLIPGLDLSLSLQPGPTHLPSNENQRTENRRMEESLRDRKAPSPHEAMKTLGSREVEGCPSSQCCPGHRSQGS